MPLFLTDLVELELPVHLEWLGPLSNQDVIDLDKLYGDAPESWGVAGTSGADWALARVACGDEVALGRFNDRILCAALLKQSEEAGVAYDYEISQLCVRKITRDRGVAKQLLVRIVQWAKAQHKSLYISGDNSRLNGLYELGFTQYMQGWRFMPL